MLHKKGGTSAAHCTTTASLRIKIQLLVTVSSWNAWGFQENASPPKYSVACSSRSLFLEQHYIRSTTVVQSVLPKSRLLLLFNSMYKYKYNCKYKYGRIMTCISEGSVATTTVLSSNTAQLKRTKDVCEEEGIIS